MQASGYMHARARVTGSADTRTNVPFVDLAGQHAEVARELEDAFARVMRDGGFTLGREVEQFEREFAAYVGARTPSASAPARMRCISRCGPAASARATRSSPRSTRSPRRPKPS